MLLAFGIQILVHAEEPSVEIDWKQGQMSKYPLPTGSEGTKTIIRRDLI